MQIAATSDWALAIEFSLGLFSLQGIVAGQSQRLIQASFAFVPLPCFGLNLIQNTSSSYP
jgi:hypothetical protein